VTLVSVQAFGVESPGGGPRILRALFEDAPLEVLNVATGSTAPPPAKLLREVWQPVRPHLGRVERSRLGGIPAALALPLQRRLAATITSLCRLERPQAVHAVAHDVSFVGAQRAARALQVPFFLSVHDDLTYSLRRQPDRRLSQRALSETWRAANHRFVISDELGCEYNRRYGVRDYSIVTDGLGDEHIASSALSNDGFRVYFAGLFHRGYIPGTVALLEALRTLENDGRKVSLSLRSGSAPPEVRGGNVSVNVLPFAPEEQVREDFRSADLLYLPLPFGAEHRNMVRFSLSTKLIAYLGAGRPIVYHGPAEGAAYQLLRKNKAALLITSLDPPVIARALVDASPARRAFGENALRLARREFRLGQQRARFWDVVAGSAEVSGRN
jgi:glycosyltransferase involved in cell wall biosynthesis